LLAQKYKIEKFLRLHTKGVSPKAMLLRKYKIEFVKQASACFSSNAVGQAAFRRKKQVTQPGARAIPAFLQTRKRSPCYLLFSTKRSFWIRRTSKQSLRLKEWNLKQAKGLIKTSLRFRRNKRGYACSRSARIEVSKQKRIIGCKRSLMW
jgi:hypothetical protein